jgi:P-type Cu2+ transporter
VPISRDRVVRVTEVALAACPACSATRVGPPPAPDRPAVPAALRRFEIALPAIHCANCISGVERCLESAPGVAAARVNLTLKRVTVTAEDVPGMGHDLVERLRVTGFEALPLDSAALEATRTDTVGRKLLARIGVAGFALMNVMLLSVAVWSGADSSTRDLMHWVSAAIALPAVAFSAQPFFLNAWTALRGGRLDMDVPISTAILLALGVSIWETSQSASHAFFDAALMLTFFLLIGRYLAHLTRTSARSAAAEIAALEVRLAARVRPDGGLETVPIDALREGDTVSVPVGARLPADGTVSEGRSEVDASMLTGETLPEPVSPGCRTRAGMLNLTAPIRIRVDALGDETLLKQIARLVETAEQSRGRYASLASRASRYYSHAVNILAVAGFLLWGPVLGDWQMSIRVAAAILIITCPCALGLAVPAVLTAASGRLFRMGVLLKDGEAFERLGQVDTVVFDKTGTLTTGEPRLIDAERIPPDSFAVAAALGQRSSHPMARAILRAADAQGIRPADVTALAEVPGCGVEGRIGDSVVRLGRAEWVGASLAATRSTSWLAVGTEAPVAFGFEDTLRAGVPEMISSLRAAGLDIELLSGDAEIPVRAAASEAGIAAWSARMTPAEKVARLQSLSAQGRRVLMVGDGLNDAAALAAADVSISPASAVDASRAAADLILLGNRIERTLETLVLARLARRRILENFALAFAYNIVTVPIAFAGYVTPLIAAIAMSASSVVVSINAMRLGRHP